MEIVEVVTDELREVELAEFMRKHKMVPGRVILKVERMSPEQEKELNLKPGTGRIITPLNSPNGVEH